MNISGDLSIAPPPPITSAVIATLRYSPHEGRFLGSKAADCLRLSFSAGSTTFTIDAFNRSEADYISSYALSQAGEWSFVAGSRDKMTCALVHSQAQATYGFLYLDELTGSLSIKSVVPESSLSSPFSSMNLTQMGSVEVGDYCDLIRLSSNVYSVGQTFTLTSSNVVAASSDLYYLIANHSLFLYSAVSKTFAAVQSLGSYDSYSLSSSYDRVVVWGGSATAAANSTFDVTQTVWVLTSSGT